MCACQRSLHDEHQLCVRKNYLLAGVLICLTSLIYLKIKENWGKKGDFADLFYQKLPKADFGWLRVEQVNPGNEKAIEIYFQIFPT